jgi:type II secretory pathway pseudopilin PulG
MTYSQKHRRRFSGLTLTELLVVISIMVLVAGVMVPMMQPILKGQNQREAARTIRMYISGIQAQAVQKQRPYGVLFERASYAFSSPQKFASYRLYSVEQLPPYTGDDYDARAMITDGSNIGLPVNDGYLYALAEKSWAAPKQVSVGDHISFQYREPRYPISDMPRGIKLTFNGIESDFALFRFRCPNLVVCNEILRRYGGNRLQFQVFRQPRKTSEPPIDLPNGTVIDLSLSGFETDETDMARVYAPGAPRFRYFSETDFDPSTVQFDRDPKKDGKAIDDLPYPDTGNQLSVAYDVVVMFGADGGIDRVHYLSRYPTVPLFESVERPVLGSIHFMIGRSDKIGVDSRNELLISDQNIHSLPKSLGEANLADETNMWLTLTGHRIFTSPNAGIDPAINLPLAKSISSTDFARLVQEARQFTHTGQALGGR